MSIKIIYCIFIICGFIACNPSKKNTANVRSGTYSIQISSPKELKAFFTYTTDRTPFVSAHRGGPGKGFPENCIATFENTLRFAPALLEIDPRYTKDSAIVLMHDATVDRTTNGTGKVADLTLKEIRNLKLKDTEGALTQYRVPTLDEALEWAKGKTVLVIDEKDVPITARANKIREHHAAANAILIAYKTEDALAAYKISSDLIFEVMMGKPAAVLAFDKSGIPWKNAVGFVTHNIPENDSVFNMLHERKVMGIIGSSRNIDKDFIEGKIHNTTLHKGYLSLIKTGADIIEADLGIEAGISLRGLQQQAGSHKKFFFYQSSSKK